MVFTDISIIFIGDRPLITQFAANNIDDFVTAAEMVYP
jgi:hypothetical protein